MLMKIIEIKNKSAMMKKKKDLESKENYVPTPTLPLPCWVSYVLAGQESSNLGFIEAAGGGMDRLLGLELVRPKFKLGLKHLPDM